MRESKSPTAQTKYLLPCSCGNRVEIESAQAGSTVRCSCGATLEVPGLRSLAALERVEAQPDQIPVSQPTWSRWKGVAFLSAVITTVGILAGVYLSMTPPPLDQPKVNTAAIDREMAKLSPTQSWTLWLKLRSGIRPKEEDRLDQLIREHTLGYESRLADHKRWTVVAFSMAGFGMLLGAVAVASGWANSRRKGEKSR